MTDLELLWAIDKYLPDKYLPLFHEMEKQAAAAPDLLAALNTAVQAFNNLVEFGLLRGDEYEHETMLIIEKLEDVIKEATQP